jgi:tetratricopeptide (TPR) repeat protein
MVLIVLLAIACGESKMYKDLKAINALIDKSPDSALIQLDKYNSEKSSWDKADRMRYDLTLLKAQNKAGVVFKSDSLSKVLVNYYGSKGTSNDRMLALYLLGRAQSDIGEAPRALQAYYDAIEQADTIHANCDYEVLIAIYGQMSRIFHKQNLPQDEIWALKHYIDYIRRTESVKEYIIAKQQLMRPYYLLGEKDSVLKIVNETYSSLKQLGEDQEATDALVTSIYIYIERGQLAKAHQVMEIFEHESGLFDKEGNISKGRESYYITKGYYELSINDNTLAEEYFRKAIKYGFASDSYRGLMSIYRKRGNVDSVMHYSVLNEEALDSIHNAMQIDAIQQMSSLYNYSRSQKEAERQEQKAHAAKFGIVVILIVVFGGAVMISLFYRRYKRRKQEEISKLDVALISAKREYHNIQEELQKLKNRDYKKLIEEKELKGQELIQMIEDLAGSNAQPDITDSLESFEQSKIVSVFTKKKNFNANNPIPVKTEWRALEMQFSKDMHAAYKVLAKDKKLSPLELHVCILLLLDFEESSIVSLTDSLPQTITTAKSRANMKIFNERGAQTLKTGLLQLIKGK